MQRLTVDRGSIKGVYGLGECFADEFGQHAWYQNNKRRDCLKSIYFHLNTN